ncbi:hypothetical protein [Solihabitans fulvus]|uniref:hypothetical protein n=1 Tax=Solihabitans fulvus TaxID=1892852 RepID=UPI001661EC78|nr:hypothetical protein [Solihabitans fulvus]
MRLPRFARAASRIAVLVALAVGSLIAVEAPAYAETNPDCASVVQIGQTAYIDRDGGTAVSVKQFKGCGKNWGYAYVWAGYRATHTGYVLCAFVDVQGDGWRGEFCLPNAVEMWSDGTDTLDRCTRGGGGLWNESAPGFTDWRC